MPEYYCHKCKIKNNLLKNAYTSSLICGAYQQENRAKHTIPSSGTEVASILYNTSTGAYQEYIYKTIAEGFVEIDNRNRMNIIRNFSTGNIGALYINGKPHTTQNAFKVVCLSKVEKIHGFPVNSEEYHDKKCIKCGAPIH